MKKLLLAAFAASALTLAVAPSSDAAQLRIGVGPNGVGVGVRAGQPGWHRWHHGPRCTMVKGWRHGHPVWVRRCW